MTLLATRKPLILPSRQYRRSAIIRVDDGWAWRRHSRITPDRYTDWRVPDEITMSAIQQVMVAGGFSAITHQYDGTSGTETVPTGASQLVATGWSSAGGGSHVTSCTSGGASGTGGYTTFIKTILSTDWTHQFTFATGTGGIGASSGNASGGAASASATMTTGTYAGFSNVTITAGAVGTTGAGGIGGAVTNANAGATNTGGLTGNFNPGGTGKGAPNGGGNVNAPTA